MSISHNLKEGRQLLTWLTHSYMPKACQGSARLHLTGDDSYIRFLQLMAMEAFGVSFNMHGLWRKRSSSSSSWSPQQTKAAAQFVGTPAFSIESLDSATAMESEGSRRMRQDRKAMGLPEGLDLSLDLGLDSTPPAPETIQAALGDAGVDEAGMERVEVGKGTEADLLDALGLVWIPPAMRTVKEPTSKDKL